MEIDILSLFPHYFAGPFDESMIKQARAKGLIKIEHHDVREFGLGKHKRVDDRPFGGGGGMVMMPEPIKAALTKVRRKDSHVVYLSPQGSLLTAKKCEELSSKKHLVLLCGHYEGIDERLLEEVDEEICIGEYVLTNGALAAIVLVDAVIRFIPGVLGAENGASQDSFQEGLLDFPHFTKPVDFEGKMVPQVLLQGNHEEIAKWRKKEALKRTKEKRPDLFLAYMAKGKRPLSQVKKIGDKTSLEITLPVSSLKKSLAFYRKVLGFIPSFEDRERVIFENGLHLVEGEPIKATVLTLKVEDKTAFEVILRKITHVKWGQGKLQTIGENKDLQITFSDPDGYQWLLVFSPKGE